MAAAEAGDEAACRLLVDSYLPAIGGIARHFDTAGVERRELVQEGAAGLLYATKRYDARVGTPFWAHASYWVRKAMRELIAEVSRAGSPFRPRHPRPCPHQRRPA